MYDLLNCPPSPIVCHPLNSLAYEKRGQPAIENESLQVVKEANGWWQHFEVVRSNTKMAKML
uniref:Uncharacterized protein n=1 Tax=Leersia perrieri TaxID=77586 RepID=A0A0D9W3R5_9ORYZ